MDRYTQAENPESRPSVCLLESVDHHTNSLISGPIQSALEFAGYAVERVPMCDGMLDLTSWVLESSSSFESHFALVMLGPMGTDQRFSEHRRVSDLFPYRVEVLLDLSPGPRRPGVSRVHGESCAVADAVMRHLLSLGHRQIGVSAGTLGATSEEDGLIASAQVCRDVVSQSGGVLHTVHGMQYSDEVLAKITSGAISAFWAMTDFGAVGLLSRIYESGLRVPEDVSLVGRYDTTWATTSVPNLTSTSIQPAEMARQTVAAVNDLFHGRIDRTYSVPHRLIIRESTGPVCRSFGWG